MAENYILWLEMDELNKKKVELVQDEFLKEFRKQTCGMQYSSTQLEEIKREVIKNMQHMVHTLNIQLPNPIYYISH